MLAEDDDDVGVRLVVSDAGLWCWWMALLGLLGLVGLGLLGLRSARAFGCSGSALVSASLLRGCRAPLLGLSATSAGLAEAVIAPLQVDRLRFAVGGVAGINLHDGRQEVHEALLSFILAS